MKAGEKESYLKQYFWRSIIKLFGFWNVYYFPKNILCFFRGHNWKREENFEIEQTRTVFGLDICNQCGRSKWID